MERWSVSGLREFLAHPLDAARQVGFLADAPDRLRHETLRRVVLHPSSTFHPPVQFVQDNRLLDEIDTSAEHTQLLLERDDTTSFGNPRALSLCDCNRRAFVGCGGEIIRIIDRLVDFKAAAVVTRSSAQVKSFAEVVGDFSATLDSANQLRLLFRLAEVVYAHPFENSSKILSGIPFRSGWEMWGQMAAGNGGICAEKTSALKFVLDVLGVETFYVAGSQYTFPSTYEQQLKAYVVSGGEAPQPIWVQHLLLGFRLDGADYLTDVSNGNLPLLFVCGDELEPFLRAGYRARMVFHVEHMQLQCISNWAGDALLTLSEFHLPELPFQYIFNQGLGLHISSEAYIGVFFDWGLEQSARQQQHYATLAVELHLPFPRFFHAENLNCLPDEGLRTMLERALTALRSRYSDPFYTGDFTFVIQPLSTDRWQRPRVSPAIYEILFEGVWGETVERF